MEAVYRILVVDDDTELGASIVEQLEAAGGFVAEAVTTIQAAEEAVSAPTSDVSALLLDVRLPDGDGRELCARLRQKGVSLPVIMVSGLDQEDDVVQGLDLGADAYVRKPFAASELIARLRKLLPPTSASVS
jgi:DNA-binding response OmpR family regulator